MSDIEFTCPKCAKRLSVDEKGAGKTVPCPGCATPVTIPASNPPPVSVAQLDQSEKRQNKTCPHCGKEILAAAIKCKHCGQMVDGALKADPVPGKSDPLYVRVCAVVDSCVQYIAACDLAAKLGSHSSVWADLHAEWVAQPPAKLLFT